MTVAALCAAALEWSDNTAANLLVAALGGPAAVTRYARSVGDRVTRLDRTEPSLNSAVPGDPRDTTTPRAMARTMLVLLAGTALAPASRKRLNGWLEACRTGNDRLRAGVPATWTCGDKTGTGDRGTSNDVAIFTPPSRDPILAAVYLTDSTRTDVERDALIAAIGRLIARTFG